jgi:hypothetical protein
LASPGRSASSTGRWSTGAGPLPSVCARYPTTTAISPSSCSASAAARSTTACSLASAQDEVLRRVAGERHLGEHDEVRAGPGGLRRPVLHRLGVADEVTDRGVDLGQGHS